MGLTSCNEAHPAPRSFHAAISLAPAGVPVLLIYGGWHPRQGNYGDIWAAKLDAWDVALEGGGVGRRAVEADSRFQDALPSQRANDRMQIPWPDDDDDDDDDDNMTRMWLLRMLQAQMRDGVSVEQLRAQFMGNAEDDDDEEEESEGYDEEEPDEEAPDDLEDSPSAEPDQESGV